MYSVCALIRKTSDYSVSDIIVIKFYFYQTDHFVSQKKSFFFIKVYCNIWKICSILFLTKISQLFKKYVIYCLNWKHCHLQSQNETKTSLPPRPNCPITGPCPHMRQLLDSGTWHQQQLKQLAAFLTPQHTEVYFTAGINSLLHRNTWKN